MPAVGRIPAAKSGLLAAVPAVTVAPGGVGGLPPVVATPLGPTETVETPGLGVGSGVPPVPATPAVPGGLCWMGVPGPPVPELVAGLPEPE